MTVVLQTDRVRYKQSLTSNCVFTKTYIIVDDLAVSFREPSKGFLDAAFESVISSDLPPPARQRLLDTYSLVVYVDSLLLGTGAIKSSATPDNIQSAVNVFSFIPETLFGILLEYVKVFKGLLQELQLEYIPARNKIEEAALAYKNKMDLKKKIGYNNDKGTVIDESK